MEEKDLNKMDHDLKTENLASRAVRDMHRIPHS